MLTLILLLQVWIVNPDNTQTTIQEDLIKLDQAFIPVWYYAYQADLEAATKANVVLQSEWRKFIVKYKLTAPLHAEWQEHVDRINAWLEQVDCDLEDKDIDFAYIHLDHAKYEMINLRKKYDLNYFIDDLYSLHESVAFVKEVIMDDMLCLLEWTQLEDLINQTILQWQEMAPVNYNIEDAEFDFSKISFVELRSKELNVQLSQLDKAIEKADQCYLQEVVQPIEPTVMELISCFGRFDLSAYHP